MFSGFGFLLYYKFHRYLQSTQEQWLWFEASSFCKHFLKWPVLCTLIWVILAASLSLQEPVQLDSCPGQVHSLRQFASCPVISLNSYSRFPHHPGPNAPSSHWEDTHPSSAFGNGISWVERSRTRDSLGGSLARAPETLLGEQVVDGLDSKSRSPMPSCPCLTRKAPVVVSLLSGEGHHTYPTQRCQPPPTVEALQCPPGQCQQAFLPACKYKRWVTEGYLKSF